VSRSPVECTSFTPFGVSGDKLAVLGEQSVSFVMGGVIFRHTFVLSQLPTTAAGILGVNFLTPKQAVLDIGNSKLSLLRGPCSGLVVSEQLSVWSSISDRRQKSELVPHVFTSKIKPQDSEVRQVKLCRAKEVPIQLESEPWSVVCKCTVVLKPRPKHVVQGKVVGDKVGNSPSLVCVDPGLVPIQGISVARVLSYAGSARRDPQQKRDTNFFEEY
jgi:hypothetical protein